MYFNACSIAFQWNFDANDFVIFYINLNAGT